MEKLIQALPKTELHLHIEGTLEPSLMLELSRKHKVNLPYTNVEEIQKAYNFEDLQSFLDLYYLGASVLVDEDDFYQLMWQYLLKCKEQNIVHTEIMFDPQTHTLRGITFETFMTGFTRAIEDAKQQWGQSSLLIMSFLRHLSEQEAIDTLNAAKPFLKHIKIVGLDSSELGNPPEKFATVFKQAKDLGLLCVAHAGEEGPAEYIWQALNLLHVDRIDHGVRSSEDPKLIETLVKLKMPLTVCPLSNTKLCVFDDMKQHNILDLLNQDVLVTVNSDDPSYFGGYLNENYLALHEALGLTQDQLIAIVKNGFTGSFLPAKDKQYWLQEIDKVENLILP
ncbi:adenosine deaminase [Aliiglaciecola lipolytica]|uniref:Adenine deaminase n=1 Tax=Aliiglaciecola lipolytica E3 TaxID=1127673 RepID=K6Y953_9ALTE|nr:adenosine deaminase [Aliiglaciecola lipolytica]GAC14732.1 adenosine deaminase [Aliiglaciecola lipolytica E3]